jgi:hypothetical protein
VSPTLHLRKETNPVSDTFCSFVFSRIPDDGQSLHVETEPKSEELATRGSEKCWTDEKSIGAHSLRWNGLTRAYTEVDNYAADDIVTCRPISRQRPQYTHATIQKVLQ